MRLQPKPPVGFSFEVSPQQEEKIRAWRAEQDKIVVDQQLSDPNSFIRECAVAGQPYYGAIGGEIIYSFSPTSVGQVLTVKHAFTGAELNVTDYDTW